MTRGKKLASRCGSALYKTLTEATPEERASLRAFVATETNCWWLIYQLAPTLSEIVGMLDHTASLQPPIGVVRQWSHSEPTL